jgi:hypothetical protein
VEEECVLRTRSFSKPCLACFFRTREVAVIEQQELEVPAPGLWIRPPRLLVSDARFLKTSDVQTNRGDPIMRLLEVWLHGQNLLQRFEGLSVLKTLRRAPQDECPRQMSFRQRWVKHEGPAAMVFRLSNRAGRGSKVKCTFVKT